VETSETQIVARRFFSSGRSGRTSETELTSACVKEILAVSRRSYKQALVLARLFVRHARGHEPYMRMMSFRVFGQVSHQSGRHRHALAAYRQAKALARTDPLARASMDRMLIDIHMYLGNYGEAKKAAGRAQAIFKRLDRQADWHQTRVNYANLLHRQDRHAGAARIYSDAAQYFEQIDNPIAAARCYYNLANTSVQLFNMKDAEDQYGRARKLYETAGYPLGSCDVRYGQAWLAMLRGEFHAALLDLEACEQIYHNAGDPRGEALCSLDRAEIDIALGLYSDALRNAQLSERRFSRLGLRYESAKSSLFRSQSALALGCMSEARKAKQRASRGFALEKNHGFMGVTALLAEELSPTGRSHAAILDKARAHFQRSQLPLWEAVCDLKAVVSDDHSSGAFRRLKTNPAVQVVPHLFASWQTALGDQHAGRGNADQARGCWHKAAERLDAVRAQLPPLELRSSFGRQMPSPHQRLIRAECQHNPRSAAIWSERKKTAGIWAPIRQDSVTDQERSRVVASLDQLSHEVGYLMYRFSGNSGERGISVRYSRRLLARLQSEVRDGLLSLEMGSTTPSESVDELNELFSTLSRQTPIVQFSVDDTAISAFVHQNNRTSVHYLPDGRKRIESSLSRWRFLLERELFSSYPGHKIKTDAEQELWSELGQWLWKPLGVDTAATSVIIVPEGELANIPWPALIVDGVSLAERHNFTLTPSLRHYKAAEERYVASSTVEVFRGAGADLPRVDEELSVLTQHANTAVVHDPAHRNDWPFNLESGIWHYAGHAVMNQENPFYSFLALADGPLFAADFRLRKCQVRLVTLAACRTGEQVALPGEESTGLVRSLLEMGAKNVIAGNWPVSDESTALWMTTFYNKYMEGEELHESARFAALTVRDLYPSAFHWSAFSVYGAGPIGGAYASN
jgi:tetratricopeptide (TPR) repeat protein